MNTGQIPAWKAYRFEGTGPKERVCVLAVRFGHGDSVMALPALYALCKKFDVTIYSDFYEYFQGLPAHVIPVDSDRIHCANGEILDMEWDEKILKLYSMLYKLMGDLSLRIDESTSSMERFATLLDVELPVALSYVELLNPSLVKPSLRLFAPEASWKFRSLTEENASRYFRALPKDYLWVGAKQWQASSIRELINTVYSARYVIAVESGIAHIAAALGIPCTIFAGFTESAYYQGQYARYNLQSSTQIVQRDFSNACNAPCNGQKERNFFNGLCCGVFDLPQCMNMEVSEFINYLPAEAL